MQGIKPLLAHSQRGSAVPLLDKASLLAMSLKIERLGQGPRGARKQYFEGPVVALLAALILLSPQARKRRESKVVKKVIDLDFLATTRRTSGAACWKHAFRRDTS